MLFPTFKLTPNLVPHLSELTHLTRPLPLHNNAFQKRLFLTLGTVLARFVSRNAVEVITGLAHASPRHNCAAAATAAAKEGLGTVTPGVSAACVGRHGGAEKML